MFENDEFEETEIFTENSNYSNETSNKKINSFKYKSLKNQLINSSNALIEINKIILKIKSFENLTQRFNDKKIIRKEFEKDLIENFVNNSPKEQDKYILNTEWAINYTNFLHNPEINNLPLPINNYKLLDSNTKEIIQNFIEQDDYVFINESAWYMVKVLYGGGPELLKNDFYLPEMDFSGEDEQKINPMFYEYNNYFEKIKNLKGQFNKNNTNSEKSLSNSNEKTNFEIDFNNNENKIELLKENLQENKIKKNENLLPEIIKENIKNDENENKNLAEDIKNFANLNFNIDLEEEKKEQNYLNPDIKEDPKDYLSLDGELTENKKKSEDDNTQSELFTNTIKQGSLYLNDLPNENHENNENPEKNNDLQITVNGQIAVNNYLPKGISLQTPKKNTFQTRSFSQSAQPGSLTSESNLSNASETQSRSISSRHSEMSIGSVGLHNQSLDCYLNSTLQCLFCVEQLNEYFAMSKYKSINYKTLKIKNFSEAYAELLKQFCLKKKNGVKKSLKQSLTPSDFKKLVRKRFDPNLQHDAHEFLRFFFNELQEELNPFNKESFEKKMSEGHKNHELFWENYCITHPSIIDSLFSGLFWNQIICKKCKKSKSIYEIFLDFSLPIVQLKIKDKVTKNVNLSDCLQAFFNREIIKDNYLCEFCKSKVQAEKIIRICKLPKYLFIHFKRFKIYPKKTKICSSINFIFDNLDLKKFCIDSVPATSYYLKSVILHSGSIEGGHYKAAGNRQNQWFLFNDEHVKQIKRNEISKKDAYIFLYQRLL